METRQTAGPSPVVIRGPLVEGLGEGQRFLAIDWVRRRFQVLLGIDPYPGTVNVRLDDEADRAAWARVRASPGILIPPEPGFCAATAYHATLQAPPHPRPLPRRGEGSKSLVPAAIVLPHVPDYPADKVELVAAVSVRETLGLQAGDHLTIHVHL